MAQTKRGLRARTAAARAAASGRKPDDLLTPKEVAKFFAASLNTIYRWALSGKLPARRTPCGKVCFRWGDVADLARRLEAGEARPARVAPGGMHASAMAGLRALGLA